MSLRPIHKNSTDVLYSPFPLEELTEIANALGFSDIKYVTKATLRPERTIYHQCLNTIQTRLRIDVLGENARGTAIADKADTIYGSVKGDFELAFKSGKHPEMEHALDQKRSMLSDFVDRLASSQRGKAWNREEFDASWPADSLRYRWQSKAIETFRVVSDRIASGEYTPRDGWDAEKVTRYWGERNLEYKHARDISRRLVDEYFSENITQDEQLTRYPTSQREGVIIFGAMGSGKSTLSRAYLERLDEETRYNMVHHDADYLKTALARTAIKEGVIKKNNGPEVQGESSNALYEGTRKRHYRSITKGKAPRVLINSICANALEMNELLEGGGSIELHHLSVDAEKAVESCNDRATVLGRKPPEEDVGWSSEVSARSLLTLADYKGANVTTYIYERETGAPKFNAAIDCRTGQVEVIDMEAFTRVAARSNLGSNAQESAKIFVQRLMEKGFSLVVLEKDVPQYSITREGVLSVKPGSTQKVPEILQSLAKETRIGAISTEQSAASHRGNALA